MSSSERDIHAKPLNPETGEELDHYEWNGWLWCHDEQEAFDWSTGEVECPHCGGEFYVQPPKDTEE